MTDHHDLAEMEGIDKCCKILGINNSGISNTRRIVVRKVVASAVRDRPIVLGELVNLVCPISAIAQRPMDENHRRSFALIHVMQGNAVSNIDRFDGRRIGLQVIGYR